jgi:outer membrane receptor for ferrienterochelin and colicins
VFSKYLIWVYSSVSLLLATPFVHGQPGVVRVLDAKTGSPAPYAHVCFFPLNGGEQLNSMTDEDGIAPNIAVTRSEVAVSYVGYVTLRDTIDPGKSITLSVKPKVQDLNEVVVTAQYAPKRVDQSIYKVKVINNRQIEQKAATNLTDLLNSDLNIRISQDGALGYSMSMQGLSGEHVKFLVDGVPVIGRMNGNIDISQINLYNVDHIEIIEGPMSVVYGSNALAGVINIITKENTNTMLDAYANGYLESVGVYNFDGGFSYRMKKHTVSLTGGRNFFNGYSDNDSLRSVRWKPKRQVMADAYYLFSEPNYKAKISGSFFDEKLQSKGNMLGPYYETAFDSYFLTTRATGKAEASSRWKSGRFLNLIGSYSFYRREKETYFVDLTTLEETRTTNPEDQDTTYFHNAMARGTFSKSREESKMNYQMGLDFNWEMGQGNRITGEMQSIGDYAAFLSVEYQPWKNLLLQPGLRVIYNTKYTAPLVYSLNVKYDFLGHYALRGSFSKGFRSPSLKELYLYFVDVNHNIRGNEDLESENSFNANLNFTYNRETRQSFVSTEVNVFYNYINNIITLAVVSGDLYTYVNLDKYITQGAQLTANYSLYPQLSARIGAGVTGIHSSLTVEAKDAQYFYYSPNVVASASYHWLKYDITFNVDYKYTGTTPQVEIDENKQLVEGYVSSYNMLDINVGRNFFKDVLGISAGVKNLLDVTTIPSTGGQTGTAHAGGSGSVPVGWGRSFFIRATINFSKI